MTRLPVIFYFTARPRWRRKRKEERQKLRREKKKGDGIEELEKGKKDLLYVDDEVQRYCHLSGRGAGGRGGWRL